MSRTRERRNLCSLLELTGANLDGEHGSVFAPMQTLEGHGLPGAESLREPREGGLVQADVEVARVHADQFVAAVAQALAGLPIDVENDPLFAEQEETVHRMVGEAAKPASLARSPRPACAR
jgi:hypothetical protein